MENQEQGAISIGHSLVSMRLAVPNGQAIRESRVKNVLDQHHDDIETLKVQLKEKEDEIITLSKMVKDLQSKNGELEVTLGARNNEIKSLKSRIGILEQEKKDVEEELASVRSKLVRFEREVGDLKEARNEQEETNYKLEETIGKINRKMEGMKEDLEKSNEGNRTLKREVKDLRDTQQKNLRQIRSLEAAGHPEDIMSFTQPRRSEPSPMLFLGEMCWQIQAKMYRAVLPAYYTPLRSYKIKAIERDIEKLPKSKEEKDDAKRKYNNLKEKLKWQERYVDVFKSLQDSRNTEAHPQVTEELLLVLTKELEVKGVLKGWLSLESIKELIEMWKNLSSSNF